MTGTATNRAPAAALLALPWLALLWLAPAAPAAAGWTLEPRPARPQAHGPMLLSLVPDEAQACGGAVAAVERDGVRVDITLDAATDCSTPAKSLVARNDDGDALRWGPEDVYRVFVHDDRGPGDSRRLVAFALVEVGPERPSIEPEAGFWWNETGAEFDRAGPGFGIALEAQAGMLSANAFGYDDQGAPGWWLGAAPLGAATARLDLVGFHGGSGPFREYRAPEQAEPAGRLHLHLLGPARATAWFERPAANGGITLEPLSLVRFRFGEAPGAAWLGRWVFTEEPRPEDAVNPPWAIDFDGFESDDLGFTLTASTDPRSLRCEQDPKRPNSPPALCRLLDAGGEAVASFPQPGLTRLQGFTRNGDRLRALRPAGR